MLGVIAAGTLGLMTTLGVLPSEKEVARTSDQVGAEQLRAIGLDAQLQPWWAVDLRLAPCAALPGMDLDAAVKASDEKLADLEAVAAVGLLRDAVEAAPCSVDWVEAGALKVALEWWGHGAQLADDERTARAAYAQLAATDPGWRIRPPPGSGFEGLWDTVRGELATQAITTLALHAGAREIRWNGVAVPGGTVRLDASPGRHLLQWSDPVGGVQGAWVLVTGRSPEAALITSTRADAVNLLSHGMETEAGRLSLRVWLSALQGAHGLDGIVVLDPESKPPGGYRLDAEGLRPWNADLQADFSMRPDRARVLVGGGWLSVQEFGFQYASLRLGADVKIAGPLHITADVSAGFSGISHPRSTDWDGGIVVLPGFGVGVMIRKPDGVAQPFGAISGGIWSAPGFDDLESTLDGALLEESSRVHEPDLPVSPRVFLDGGLDLVPAGRAFVVRMSAGVGYGLGLQVRAGVLAGVRFGR
jgi:hypothetical protein